MIADYRDTSVEPQPPMPARLYDRHGVEFTEHCFWIDTATGEVRYNRKDEGGQFILNEDGDSLKVWVEHLDAPLKLVGYGPSEGSVFEPPRGVCRG